MVKESETTDPNMATSSSMIGSSVAWADGYTGAGSKVAIIDTGADTDHPSLNGAAYSYAVKGLGIPPSPLRITLTSWRSSTPSRRTAT